MTNNSDGLSPTLRPQIGVGWNRALPAPFGFDNGLHPDGVNDYLEIPSLARKMFSEIFPFTVEIWSKGKKSKAYNGLFYVLLENGSWITCRASVEIVRYTISSGGVSFSGTSTTINLVDSTPKWLWAVGIDDGRFRSHSNGLDWWSGTSTSFLQDDKINFFRLLLGRNNISWETPVDEVRVYNRPLSNDEARLNWNDGVGNNPAKTEGLIAYYKFEEFEMLDFSEFQDNSDIRLGIRDLSGNNNHAVPVNMDTNPESPNYVLKPF